MAGCSIVCEIIVPNAGEKLLQSYVLFSECASGDLVALMQAYKNAPTRNLKTQILSLYAYRYPMKKLQKLHEPYESITTWQILQLKDPPVFERISSRRSSTEKNARRRK